MKFCTIELQLWIERPKTSIKEYKGLRILGRIGIIFDNFIYKTVLGRSQKSI